MVFITPIHRIFIGFMYLSQISIRLVLDVAISVLINMLYAFYLNLIPSKDLKELSNTENKKIICKKNQRKIFQHLVFFVLLLAFFKGT